MAKIIIVNNEKPDFHAHETLTTLVEFSVIRKNENEIELTANTDKGLSRIILNNEEVTNLIEKLQEKHCR